MDFFTIVIILAIIVLILVLTYIGIAMSKLNTSEVFPPNANVCPDYWIEVEPGKCQFPKAGSRNTGDFTTGTTYTSSGNPSVSGETYLSGSSNSIGEVYGSPASLMDVTTGQIKEIINVNDESKWTSAYKGMSVKCAKKKWASSHGITWDGITNANSC